MSDERHDPRRPTCSLLARLGFLQRSMRRVAVMPPEAIRTLPFGTALVLLRSAPPVVTELRPWTVRRDAEELRIDRTAIEATLRRR